MGATALVVQNTPSSGPRRWAQWLDDGGLALHVVAAYDGEQLPDELDGYQALLVLGGGFLPDDDARAPWLPRTRALVGEAIERGVPYFGICLGGQLLAQVAGGSVQGSYGEPEFGSTGLRMRAEAADDPLFRDVPAAPTAIENHKDAITGLPPGAHWLAESERCPYQAFRLADAPAWGVQFHPEAPADRIRQWNPERLAPYGLDRDALHRAAERDEPAARETWHAVALRFAALAAEQDADTGGAGTRVSTARTGGGTPAGGGA